MKRVTRRYGGGRVVEAVRVLVQVAHLLRGEELGGEVALGHVERHLNAHQLVQQSHVLDHLRLRQRGSEYAHERGEAEGELRHVHVLLLRCRRQGKHVRDTEIAQTRVLLRNLFDQLHLYS